MLPTKPLSLPLQLTLVLLALAGVLLACSFGNVPLKEPLQDSNPVFVSTPLGLQPPTPTHGSGDNQAPTVTAPASAANLYFIIVDPQSYALSLGRLPGACVTGQLACPAVEIIPGFPNQNAYIYPLAWSPDGMKAVLPVENTLYLYHATTNTWQVLAQAFVGEVPEWSPDSNWVAYTAKDDNNVGNIYIVRSDGSIVRNLTNGQYGSDHHLAGIFWLGQNRLAFWHFSPQQDKELLQMQVDNGAVQPLINMAALTKDILAYSPDLQSVAIEAFAEGESQLLLANADGSNVQVAGRFGQASIWPMVWAPNGQQLAFNVYRSPEADPFSHVYVLPRDGAGGPVEIFTAQNIAALAWSPDSQYLVIQADLESRSGLFVAPADGRGFVRLAAPGIEPGAILMAPSWQILP